MRRLMEEDTPVSILVFASAIYRVCKENFLTTELTKSVWRCFGKTFRRVSRGCGEGKGWELLGAVWETRLKAFPRHALSLFMLLTWLLESLKETSYWTLSTLPKIEFVIMYYVIFSLKFFNEYHTLEVRRATFSKVLVSEAWQLNKEHGYIFFFCKRAGYSKTFWSIPLLFPRYC